MGKKEISISLRAGRVGDRDENDWREQCPFTIRKQLRPVDHSHGPGAICST